MNSGTASRVASVSLCVEEQTPTRNAIAVPWTARWRWAARRMTMARWEWRRSRDGLAQGVAAAPQLSPGDPKARIRDRAWRGRRPGVLRCGVSYRFIDVTQKGATVAGTKRPSFLKRQKEQKRMAKAQEKRETRRMKKQATAEMREAGHDPSMGELEDIVGTDLESDADSDSDSPDDPE